MARNYLVSLLDANVDIAHPSGSVSQTIRRGQRYLTAEAVVRRHADLFAPADSWHTAPAPAPHPKVRAL